MFIHHSKYDDSIRHIFRPWYNFASKQLHSRRNGVYEVTSQEFDLKGYGEINLIQMDQGKPCCTERICIRCISMATCCICRKIDSSIDWQLFVLYNTTKCRLPPPTSRCSNVSAWTGQLNSKKNLHWDVVFIPNILQNSILSTPMSMLLGRKIISQKIFGPYFLYSKKKSIKLLKSVRTTFFIQKWTFLTKVAEIKFYHTILLRHDSSDPPRLVCSKRCQLR